VERDVSVPVVVGRTKVLNTGKKKKMENQDHLSIPFSTVGTPAGGGCQSRFGGDLWVTRHKNCWLDPRGQFSTGTDIQKLGKPSYYRAVKGKKNAIEIPD